MAGPTSSQRVVRFGVFEFDREAEELRKQGLKVKLHGQPVQVLELLLEQPGRVVTREELRQKLWSGDTFVDFEHGLNAAIQRLREALGDSADNPRFVETLPRRGYRFIYPVEGLEPAQPAEAALAVLPLENLSGDPEQDYFADGMTEALITELGKISALRVVSRQSVMQFKGTDKPLPEIARELNVGAVVEGSVRRVGDRVRISAQLVRAVPERQLWADSFERELSDVLALESEMARAIAQEVRAKLTRQEQARLASARRVNPEAHEAYLKGRYHREKHTEEEIKKAIGYFEQAIEKDPGYAPAYAAKADAYARLGGTAIEALPPKEVLPKAKAAAVQALDLDASLADAHAALGHILAEYDWQWARAESEFKRVIELNPSYTTAHQWYAELLHKMGRHEQSIAEIKQAQKLDPLSPYINLSAVFRYWLAGQYDETLAEARKALDMHPDFWETYLPVGYIYLRRGTHEKAVAEFRKAVTLSARNTASLAWLGHAYGVAGKREEALNILAELEQRSKRKHVTPFEMAMVYAGLGENGLALDWLEKGYRDRAPTMGWLKVMPHFDSLRSTPRFQSLLRRMNFPE